MIRRPPRSTLSSSSAASDVYKRQDRDRKLSFGEMSFTQEDNKEQISRMERLVEVKNLKKWFWLGKSPLGKKIAVRAVDDVSFYIEKKEVLGLVGESGCGKTTCGKTILRILDPTEGKIYFNGRK